MKNNSSSLLIVLAVILIAACKSNSTSPNNNNGGNSGGNGSTQIIATINGKTITFATAQHEGFYSPGPPTPTLMLGIDGTANTPPGAEISLNGGGGFSTGTFDIGTNAPFSLTYSYDTTYSGNPVQYQIDYSSDAGNGGSVGSVTISSVSSSGVQGSFHANLPVGSGPDTTPASITNGTFYISFSN